jgi:citrate synthase
MYHGTAIDGVTLKPEQLNVRGRDLNAIIGDMSYVAAVYHLLTGQEPSPAQCQALDRYLFHVLLSVEPEDTVLKLVETVAQSNSPVPQALIAGLMGDMRASIIEVQSAWSDEEMEPLTPCQEGLYYWGLMPCLLTCAVDAHSQKSLRNFAEARNALKQAPCDYTEAIFFFVTGRRFGNAVERALFEAVMVGFHAGFGFLTPTIMLPRGAGGTGVGMPIAIAAGYTAAGPSHVGACDKVMTLFTELSAERALPLTERITAEIQKILAVGQHIPGFGHPVFSLDPRNTRLRELIAAQNYTGEFIMIYDHFVEAVVSLLGIQPNIDCISAAILLSLGIRSPYGTGLFLCSRTSAMVAHIIERRNQPAFGANSKRIRELLLSIPAEAAQYFLL